MLMTNMRYQNSWTADIFVKLKSPQNSDNFSTTGSKNTEIQKSPIVFLKIWKVLKNLAILTPADLKNFSSLPRFFVTSVVSSIFEEFLTGPSPMIGVYEQFFGRWGLVITMMLMMMTTTWCSADQGRVLEKWKKRDLSNILWRMPHHHHRHHHHHHHQQQHHQLTGFRLIVGRVGVYQPGMCGTELFPAG